MKKLVAPIGLVALVLFAVAPAFAADEEDEELDLLEHEVDAPYLDFEPFGVVELPRIFLLEDASGSWTLEAYSSTKSALRSGGYMVVLEETEDGHAEAASTEELIAQHEHLHATLVPAGDAHIVADFSITKHYVFGLLGALLTLIIFIRLANQYKKGIGRETAPRGVFQNMFETLIVFVRDEIAKPNIGDKYQTFLPYLLTAFFFILFCNLLGLVPYGAAATANIVVTGILAFFTFLIGHLYASKDHWRHLLTGPPGVPKLIRALLIPVEILGLIARHAALAIRLFANMTAGGLVILSLLSLIFIFNGLFGSVIGWTVAPFSVLLTLFIFLVKLLVAFIQAYVFTILSALFIGMAVEEHHEHEDSAPEHHGVAHEEVTPHLIGDDEVEERTHVHRQPEPVVAG